MSDQVKKPSILIVDDVVENLHILKNTLVNDYVVRPATHGQLALKLAVMEPQPDLILLDIMMPEMDGYEVCRILKSDHRTANIPIIFVTAKTGDQDELKGLQMGAVDYITKPISPHIVKTRIKTYLTLHQFNQQMEEKNQRLYTINERLTDSMEQLAASEDRFRSLVQTIPDIVYKIDAEGKFIFLNKSVERLGYHQSDLIGKHFSELIHIDDLPQVSLEKVIDRVGKGTSNPGQKVFDERRSGPRMTVGLELRLKTKTGQAAGVIEITNIDWHTINVEVNSTGLYGETGNDSSYRSRQYVGTVGVIRDVTDRQKAQKAIMEERLLLRHLIDAVPLPIFYMEDAKTISLSNKAFREFFGLPSEEPASFTLEQLLTEAGTTEIATCLTEILDNPDVTRTRQEISLASHSNHAHAMDVTLCKFQQPNTTTTPIIGVLVDITAQKTFTSQLSLALQQAEQSTQKAKDANRAKGEFLANMSHEIRTPLNAVIGLTYLCLQTQLTEQQRDYLNKTNLSANSLLQLLNDILDFSKIEAGKLSLEQAKFNLVEMLDGVVTMLSLKSQEKGLELLVDIDQNVPTYLKGDSHRLRQVCTNLVNNAIKFTDQGEISIIVTLVEEEPYGVMLQFAVIDTGIGLTQTQIEKLFQKFFQGDTSTTRKYGGTGLGLAISKRLVEMMGGRINVRSRATQGSEFSFTARLTKVDHTAQTLPTIPEELHKLHILMVDDNETFRKTMIRHLETVFDHPVAVENGLQALEQLAQADHNATPFDLVMMDWQMPSLNGLETTRSIQTLNLKQNPKIIMVTSYSKDEMLLSEADKSLFHGFLIKPVNRASLFHAINTTFGHNTTNTPLMDGSKPRSFTVLAGAKILLAEDNDINQQVALELLEKINIEVTIANHGQEALELANRTPFDGILMDLQMPVMGGLEATRKIRQNHALKKLPIIAMTANAMSSDREICLQAGMNDHIGKPVIPNELYGTLERWVQHKPAQRLVTSLPSNGIHEACGTPPLPSLSGINMAMGLRNTGDNHTLYRKILLKFARNQGGACQQMEQHIAAGDYVALEQVTHALKGVAATIGAQRLAYFAGKMEKLAQDNEGVSSLREWLGETASELARIITNIETMLVEASTPIDQELGNQKLGNRGLGNQKLGDQDSRGLGNQKLGDQDSGNWEQAGLDVSSEMLAPLFKKAEAHLMAFDAAVEKVVDEIVPLAQHTPRKKRLHAIQETLANYDFETCLTLLREWADEEGVPLEKP